MTSGSMTTPAHRTGRTVHTPGPWVANGEVHEVKEASGKSLLLYCAGIVLGDDDPRGWRGYIASVQSADHIGNGITREEAEANARLIAAAPGLLAALERARPYVKPSHPGDIQADADLRAIDAALSASRTRSTGE